MCTKNKVNVFIEQKLKEVFKGKKKRGQGLRTFEKVDVSESEGCGQFLVDSNVSRKSDES